MKAAMRRVVMTYRRPLDDEPREIKTEGVLMMEWIKAEVQKPESSTPMDFKPVLVWLDGRVRFGYYFSSFDGWRIENSPSEWLIEWWMPLPQPPEK